MIVRYVLNTNCVYRSRRSQLIENNDLCEPAGITYLPHTDRENWEHT